MYEKKLREGAIRQADEYLNKARKSEVWKLIDRLRDELVRADAQIDDFAPENFLDVDLDAARNLQAAAESLRPDQYMTVKVGLYRGLVKAAHLASRLSKKRDDRYDLAQKAATARQQGIQDALAILRKEIDAAEKSGHDEGHAFLDCAYDRIVKEV